MGQHRTVSGTIRANLGVPHKGDAQATGALAHACASCALYGIVVACTTEIDSGIHLSGDEKTACATCARSVHRVLAFLDTWRAIQP
jgi:hypothetical protein